jgi:hypothetical protein
VHLGDFLNPRQIHNGVRQLQHSVIRSYRQLQLSQDSIHQGRKALFSLTSSPRVKPLAANLATTQQTSVINLISNKK